LDSSLENPIYHNHDILTDSTHELATLTYIYGITSYLIVCSEGAGTNPFANWKVLIHTNYKTRASNPHMFEVFKKMGAIIGIIDEDKFFSSTISDKEVAEYLEKMEKEIIEAQSHADSVEAEYEEAVAADDAATDLQRSKFAEGQTLFMKLKNVSLNNAAKTALKDKYKEVTAESLEVKKVYNDASKRRRILSDELHYAHNRVDYLKNNLSRFAKAKLSIIRLTRYYPLFYSNVPVFVRDADTIFADLIRSIMFGNVNLKDSGFEIHPLIARKFDVDMETSGPVSKSEHAFPNGLRNWEVFCLQQCQKFASKQGTTFFMGIDNYNFRKESFNVFSDINTVDVHLKDLSPEDLGRLRGLAGLLCSLEKLPIHILDLLTPLIKKVVYSNVNVNFIDEIYLSYPLYRTIKSNGKLGFIAANYVLAAPARNYICSEYKRQKGLFEKNTYLSHLECDRGEGMRIQKINEISDLYQLFFLKHPNIHIPDQAFYNPLKDPEFTKIAPGEHITTEGKWDFIPEYIKNNNAENKNIRFTSYPIRSMFRRSKNTRKRKSHQRRQTRQRRNQ
jgi:hypothetical protein